MAEIELNRVQFAPPGPDSFMDAVSKKVRHYFKSRGISQYANTAMWIKTLVMISLYFVPYFIIVTGLAANNSWVFFGMWFLMAWGMIGIGTSVMHDAHHGAYSANPRVNKLIGHILEIIGGYSVTWKIQHNELHHTYTNVAGLDEDIDSIKLLRFSSRQPRY